MTALLSRRALLAVLVAAGVPGVATTAFAAPADDVKLLNGLLAIEHAAIYDLAVLGGRLGVAARAELRLRYDEHRLHRDRLQAEVVRLGGEPVAAEPVYRLPGPVGGKATLRTAELVERAAASAYHQAIGGLEDRAARTLCVASLLDEARHLALARRASGVRTTAAADAFVTGA